MLVLACLGILAPIQASAQLDGDWRTPLGYPIPTAEHTAVWTGTRMLVWGGADGSFAALEFRWDWDGDGGWDTDWLEEHTVTHVFPTAGTYAISMQTRDNDNLIAETLRSIVVTVGPLAYFSIEEKVIELGEQLFADASASEAGPGRTIDSWEWDWELDGGLNPADWDGSFTGINFIYGGWHSGWAAGAGATNAQCSGGGCNHGSISKGGAKNYTTGFDY